MKRILISLLIVFTLSGVEAVGAAPTTSETVARSALSKCLARAKRKKGAFARVKAIRACYAANKKRIGSAA